MGSLYKKEMDTLVGEILNSYQEHPETCSINTRHRLNNDIIIDLLEKIRSIVFPGFFETKTLNESSIEYHVGELLEDIQYRLTKQVTKALFHSAHAPEDEEEAQQQDERRLRLCERVFCRGETAAPNDDRGENDDVIVKTRPVGARVVEFSWGHKRRHSFSVKIYRTGEIIPLFCHYERINKDRLPGVLRFA